VPVPLASLLAAKARAWAIIVGGIAAAVFTIMSVSVPGVSVATRLAAGLLVTAGAAGMSFVAVAMASGGADLSDETNNAVGPSTIYAYLGVGALFNVVLIEASPLTRVAGLILYGLAGWAYWQAGVEHAGFCMDAEAVRARHVRAADGATMLILLAAGGRALQAFRENSGGAFSAKDMLSSQIVLLVLIGIAAGIYLVRRPRPVPRLGASASLLVALGTGALGVGATLAAGNARSTVPLGAIAVAAAMVAVLWLAQELVLRGILQRALPLPRVGAAAVSFVAGVVSAQLFSSALATRPAKVVALVAAQAAASLVYAVTGRVAASWVVRVVMTMPFLGL
jgi:hypothetical protein